MLTVGPIDYECNSRMIGSKVPKTKKNSRMIGVEIRTCSLIYRQNGNK